MVRMFAQVRASLPVLLVISVVGLSGADISAGPYIQLAQATTGSRASASPVVDAKTGRKLASKAPIQSSCINGAVNLEEKFFIGAQTTPTGLAVMLNSSRDSTGKPQTFNSSWQFKLVATTETSGVQTDCPWTIEPLTPLCEALKLAPLDDCNKRLRWSDIPKLQVVLDGTLYGIYHATNATNGSWIMARVEDMMLQEAHRAGIVKVWDEAPPSAANFILVSKTISGMAITANRSLDSEEKYFVLYINSQPCKAHKHASRLACSSAATSVGAVPEVTKWTFSGGKLLTVGLKPQQQLSVVHDGEKGPYTFITEDLVAAVGLTEFAALDPGSLQKLSEPVYLPPPSSPPPASPPPPPVSPPADGANVTGQRALDPAAPAAQSAQAVGSSQGTVQQEQQQPSSPGFNLAAIIGGVVGGVVLAALIAGLALFGLKRKKDLATVQQERVRPGVIKAYTGPAGSGSEAEGLCAITLPPKTSPGGGYSSRRRDEDTIRALSGMYQPGWSPEEIRGELREVEGALEAWLGMAKRDQEVLAGLTAAALKPLGASSIADVALLREAVKSAAFLWLKAQLWGKPERWVKDYPAQPEDEWSAEQYRALLAGFRQAVEPQVVATAAHNMALALGVPASHYQQQELAQAVGGSPRQQPGGGGGGDAAVLRVVVEGAMRVWLRVKGTNPEYTVRVSGCRKHGELSRLHEGVEHVVRRVVQPQPPFEDAQLGPGRAPRVLLTCRPGVVMLGNGAHQPPTQVVVQEEVVACVQSDLAAMV